MNCRPVIVVSATRFFQGGTLVVVAECLKFLSARYGHSHAIKALVYKKSLYAEMDEQLKTLPFIEWIEFPDARTSVFNRLYHEYIKFNRLSKAWQPELWLSLQDSTPRVQARSRAVYYHNPLLLMPKGTGKLWRYQPRLALLRLLYRYIYTSGIASNDFIITQQEGIADYLQKTYRLTADRIRVFPPTAFLLTTTPPEPADARRPPVADSSRGYTFIFPATAFYYKNHQVIIDACRQLVRTTTNAGGLNFRVLLTIDGTENSYVRKLAKRAQQRLPQIEFLGFLKREQLFEYYKEADCMIFPSLLESWGLPLTEFAGLRKPILCADLPYGRSTLEGYDLVHFFDPMDALKLAAAMEAAITGRLRFDSPDGLSVPKFLTIKTWGACFDLLLES